MNEIIHKKRQLECQLYEVCERIMRCIHTKIQIASTCSKNEIEYNFLELNTHGCPVLSPHNMKKIKKYIKLKLYQEGFKVHEYRTEHAHVLWNIKIQW
jgi:hypothetical protein